MRIRPIFVSCLTYQAYPTQLTYLNQPDELETGSVTRNRVPTFGALLTSIRPSCASTILRTMGSPRPDPFTFVVKNGSKILSVASAGTPGPSSMTSTTTVGVGACWPVSAGSASIVLDIAE